MIMPLRYLVHAEALINAVQDLVPEGGLEVDVAVGAVHEVRLVQLQRRHPRVLQRPARRRAPQLADRLQHRQQPLLAPPLPLQPPPHRAQQQSIPKHHAHLQLMLMLQMLSVAVAVAAGALVVGGAVLVCRLIAAAGAARPAEAREHIADPLLVPVLILLAAATTLFVHILGAPIHLFAGDHTVR